MNSQDFRSLQEAYFEVYDNIMEREDSPYEKASDAALDARYGYGRASGDKRSFGRAANRSSAAAALRAIRRGERSGSGTSTEAGADAVHRGWAKTAKTSTDQTPEKKEKRAKLANTEYRNLPDDEKEKDRVSFNAVKAVYKRRTQREEYDLYDIILSHLLDKGYAETPEAAEVIMVNMSEEWRQSIMEGVRPGNVESPLDKATFNKRRRSLAGREKSADAKSRGHVSKNIVTHGRTYSPDEAKSNRENLSNYEREQRKSFNINPDQVGDTRETADKTKNPKKLRKQTAMGEHG